MLSRKLTVVHLLALTLLCFPKSARSYDAPGHFYTVTYALKELGVPERDRNVIAFCSWLPDASVELSATGVLAAAASSCSEANGQDAGYLTAIKMVALHAHWEGAWKVKSCGYSSDPGRINFDPDTMLPVVIVQQYIHGLTGGDPDKVTSAARELATNLWNQAAKARTDDANRANLLCATGFALHLLGDSYAHRHLKDEDHTSEAPMYPTGCGHASAPSEGHLPDHPLGIGYRWQDWQKYFDQIAAVFGSSGFKATTTAWFHGLSRPPGTPSVWLFSTSDDNECLFEDSLWGHITSKPAVQTEVCQQSGYKHPGYMPSPGLGIHCQGYVRQSASAGFIDVQPNCQETWKIYKEAAGKYFAQPGVIAPEFDYNYPPFGRPGFYEDAEPNWDCKKAQP